MTTAPPRSRSGAGSEPEALIREARRRQRRRYLLTGLTVVVLAGAAGVTIGRLGPGGGPDQGDINGPLASAPVQYSRIPGYYAYTVQGDIYHYVAHGTDTSSSVDGRYLKVRATATGKLLATITPPKPCNDFSLLTADANGDRFVLGAVRYWERNAGPSPRLARRDMRTPMKFLLLRIMAGGHVRVSGLSLPRAVTPGQGPTIALSPDGTRLAVASGGGGQAAVVQVITLGTGQARQWAMPRAPWRPVLNRQGAWTADGRTLALHQQIMPRLRGKPPTVRERYRPPGTTQVRLLDTMAPGTGLASGRLLVLPALADVPAPAQPFITPDGTKLLASVATEPFRRSLKGRWSGRLAVYSARTGALLRSLAPWVWRWTYRPGRGGSPQQTVAWSDRTGSRLIVLQPRHDLNVLGALTGSGFSGAGGTLLPQRPAGYRELQYALRVAPQMTW
ncbi:MAG: hypothetical protein LBI49_26810 [Nocardiopsaceae bacterium]|jgi:hypothetical protein|nr:hypothetical protein [Nocardiopsaceae bacterium]